MGLNCKLFQTNRLYSLNVAIIDPSSFNPLATDAFSSSLLLSMLLDVLELLIIKATSELVK